MAESSYNKLNGKLAFPFFFGHIRLDNFATINEADAYLKTDPFQVISPALLNGLPASLNLSISDANVDSAIFEYIEGKLAIHYD